jgi:HSP20 family molecular chaperone IbpA
LSAPGRFVGSIELAVEIDDGKVNAQYKHGLLLVNLTKAEKAKPRQIPVQVESGKEAA